MVSAPKLAFTASAAARRSRSVSATAAKKGTRPSVALAAPIVLGGGVAVERSPDGSGPTEVVIGPVMVGVAALVDPIPMVALVGDVTTPEPLQEFVPNTSISATRNRHHTPILVPALTTATSPATKPA